jgi:hypothetical protein
VLTVDCRSVVAALGAYPVKDEWPRVDRDTKSAGLAADRLVQPVESERYDPAALAAEQVVALGVARVGREVAGLTVAKLEPVHEPVAAQQLEHLIDARPSDMCRLADLPLELLGADRICRIGECADDDGTGRAAVMPAAAKRVLDLLDPFLSFHPTHSLMRRSLTLMYAVAQSGEPLAY